MSSRKPLPGTLLLILLALCLTCTGQQSPREVPASIGSSREFDYLSYIPEEANMLFYVNLEELRRSPFGREVQAAFEEGIREGNSEYWEFLDATGLDLERDVYEVWVSAVPNEGYREDFNGAILVRGHFDQDRILDYIRNKSDRRPQMETYADTDLYVVENRRGQPFGYGFLDSETFLAGSPFWLERVIDLSKSRGANVLDNPVISDHIRRIPQRQHLWGVVDADRMTDYWAEELRRGSDFQGTESLENMESLVFYAEFDQRANVFIEGIFRTDEQAELLAETLNGFKAMAKLMVADDREAMDMLNEIKVRSRGETLNISAQLDRDFFDKWEQKRRNFRGQGFKF